MAQDIYDSDGNYVGTTDEYAPNAGDTLVPAGSSTPASSGGGNTNTLSNLIGSLGGVAGQVLSANKTQAQKAKPATSNTMLYVGIGAAVLVLLVFVMGGKRS